MPNHRLTGRDGEGPRVELVDRRNPDRYRCLKWVSVVTIPLKLRLSHACSEDMPMWFAPARQGLRQCSARCINPE